MRFPTLSGPLVALAAFLVLLAPHPAVAAPPDSRTVLQIRPTNPDPGGTVRIVVRVQERFGSGWQPAPYARFRIEQRKPGGAWRRLTGGETGTLGVAMGRVPYVGRWRYVDVRVVTMATRAHRGSVSNVVRLR